MTGNISWSATGRGVAATIIAIMVAGCDGQQVRQSGVMGADAEVGDIQLRSVHIEAPAGPRYQAGDSAVVWLTVLNQGRQLDNLVDVTTPYGRQVEIRWDQACDGEAEQVDTLPLLPADPVPDPPTFGAPPFDNYHLRIVGLNREVLAGTTVPLTFSFADAGRVDLQAHVQPSTVTRPEPSTRCTPDPTTS